jgi:DNA topoisomerase IB
MAAPAKTRARTIRLRRSDLTGPGIRRLRSGRGFRYLDADGQTVAAEELIRIKDLVIPPAWKEVWICPWPNGHIQAVGFDAAGRRQYLYHPRWREKRDKQKHDHVLDFAAALPDAREIVIARLDGRGLTKERVLSACFRLLDLGFFRVGGDRYAEDNGTFGLATLQREHVSFAKGELTFDYPAKGGYERIQAIADPQVVKVIQSLRSRQSDDDSLFAYYQDGSWHRVHSSDINNYLKELTGLDVSAKDFRTWNATVLAAVGLAVSPVPRKSASSRKRAIARVVKEVSQYLGNTPSVCRASYIDPRVIERYQRGETVEDALELLGQTEDGALATQGAIEVAVLALLRPSLVQSEAS